MISRWFFLYALNYDARSTTSDDKQGFALRHDIRVAMPLLHVSVLGSYTSSRRRTLGDNLGWKHVYMHHVNRTVATLLTA